MNTQILECTLRDGSYAINFQFTADDTRTIGAGLESVGFGIIEVGHGIGLGASDKKSDVAAETDEAYLKAAAESITKSMWGMFCIPGIADIYHVDMAAGYGMKFIRVGTNIEDYKQAEPYIKRAKQHGMMVCANFMKSYVSAPEDFAKYALEAEKYGADYIYIVDSAGGMLPEEIEQYVHAIRSKSDSIRLGFHGHNNLGLGVINGIKAMEMGIDLIDTSLQGLGRSAGNIPTEQFLCVLMRKGHDMDIDPVAVMDLAEKYIQPLIRTKGHSSIDITSGLALFHSSYLPMIEKCARKYRVDPRKLIISVCEHDKVDAPEALVEEQAKRLAEMGVRGSWKPLYTHYYGGEQDK